MDGLNRITERIATDTEREAEQLLVLAREEARVKHLSYQDTAANRGERILEHSRQQARELIQRTTSAAELEARKTLLSVRQSLVSEVFEKARVALSALSPADYSTLLIRLTVNASLTGTEEIIMNPEDHQRYGSEVVAGVNQQLKAQGKEGQLTLSAETRSFSGGLILKSGPIESNCTLEVLVKLAQHSMTAEVARHLFPE